MLVGHLEAYRLQARHELPHWSRHSSQHALQGPALVKKVIYRCNASTSGIVVPATVPYLRAAVKSGHLISAVLHTNQPEPTYKFTVN
jgi:hypothetical protein